MALDLQDANTFRAAIRYDPLTKRGSVLDVVGLVMGVTAKHASTTLTGIVEKFPDVSNQFGHFKFPGQGQRPTPVAHLSTLLEIAWLCPGRRAQEFRRGGAVTMCRALGGDLSLVEEIRRRHSEVTAEEQEAFLAGTGVTAAEANGTAVVVRSPEELRALQLSNHRTALELAKEAGALAEQWKAVAAGEEDTRHRLFIEDTAKNLFMRYSQLATGGSEEGVEARLPLSISGVASDLGFKKLAPAELSAIGKVAARLYRDQHGTAPSKHTQYVDGTTRLVCSYTTEDRSLLEEAVHTVLG